MPTMRIPILRSLLLFAALALSAGPTLAGSVEQLREFAANVRSARGEFQQRTLKSNGQVVEAGSGTFAFARPGKFRWEVLKPYEQLMVADAEQVQFFDKDLNQVTVRKISDALGATPAAILFGSADLEQTFTLTDLGERSGLQWLEARPKSKEAGFEVIAIGFRSGMPEAMEVHDAFGRHTLFAFKAIERNPAIDPANFRFTPPKGADVVRQ
jgi:outer membrane lipoprotein carrier protein